MTPICKTLQQLAIAIVLLLCSSVLAQKIKADSSLLVLNGNIRRELYNFNSNSPVAVFETKVTAHSSNSWWRIIATPANENELPVDCKRIPDGIRLLPIIADVSKIARPAGPHVDGAAQLFPLAYPPPGSFGLFSAWLAFVQQPELPIINGKNMRRFLDVSLQNNANNIGTYSLSYLSNSVQMLAHLSITNDGAVFLDDGKVSRLGGKFSSGYQELLYEVLETTNIAGLTFPLKSKLTGKALGPREVYNRCIDHITLESVAFSSASDMQPENKRIMAFDQRFEKITKGKSVNYIVTNDTWIAVTNAQLASMVPLFADQDDKKVGKRGYLMLLSVVSLVLLPIFISAIVKNVKTKNQ